MASIGKLVKGILGSGSAAFENKVGLSQAKLDELLALLKPLDDFGTDLCDRVLRQLLDGVNDDEALGQLAGAKDAAQKLQLLCATRYGMSHVEKRWASFLNPIEPVDPGFYLRLGKVFEAAARNLPPHGLCSQAERDDAPWPETRYEQGTLPPPHTWSSLQRSAPLSGPLIDAMLKADGRDAAHFLTAPFKIAKTRAWQQNQMR